MPRALVLLLFATVLFGPQPAKSIVPFGFSDDLLADGFNLPVGVTFDHLGRTFVWEKRGMVWIVDATDTVLSTPLLDLTDEVLGQHDRGMLGLVLDPNYAANGYIYVLYNIDPVFGEPDDDADSITWGRLTRYTVVGDQVDLGTRLVLLGATAADGVPSCHNSHSIGTLAFGTDGSLFVGSGDGAHYDFTDGGQNVTSFDPDCEATFVAADNGALRSQTFDTLAGKILRIDPATGLGYTDNPWYDGVDLSSVESRAWVIGMRNPYRFTVRPLQVGQTGPGSLYMGDVGWGTWEELDVAHGGENFGWPCFEGDSPQGSYQSNPNTSAFCSGLSANDVDDALIAWHHSNPGTIGFVGNAAAGAVFYDHTSFPSTYHGKVFFADYGDSWIRVAEVDENDQLLSHEPFATGLDRPVDLKVDPNTGDLVYPSVTAGQVRRIRNTLTPVPPIVVAQATPSSGPLPLDVQFSSDGTLDPNGDPFTVEWDFGDGAATSSDPNPIHQYTTLGTFDVTLTATDIGGLSDSTSVTVQTINLPPTVTIDTPQNGGTFDPPELITLAATGSDPEDGDNITWSWVVDLVHNNHPHPGWHTSTSQVSEFSAISHGDTGDRFSYRITVEVTDTGGETATDEVWIVPVGQAINSAPIPAFSMDTHYGVTPLVVQFDATPTVDPEGDLMVMDWTFGDGTVGSGLTTSHIYGAPGLYTVQLDVHDSGLAMGTGQATILVEPAGASAHWPLDEDGGLTAGDISPNLHDGNVSGALWTPGVKGSALDFNGTDAWVGTGSTFLSNRSAFTLAAWVQPRSTGSRVGLVGQNDAIEFGFISTAQLQLWTPGGGNVGAAWPYPMGEWHHVIAMGDGEGLSIWIDGIEVASIAQPTGNYGSSGDPVNFGGGGVFDNAENWFDGLLDEVRIYDRALSPGEIALLATAPASNAPPVVDAGPDGDAPLGPLFALLGSVSDDGNPAPPSQTTVTWSQSSGPSPASIFDPTSLFTWVTFPEAGAYVFQLEANDTEMTTVDLVTITVEEVTAAQEVSESIVAGLQRIHPNPVQGRTTIAFGVARDGAPVRVNVFGIDGRRVKTLFDAHAEAGNHQVVWNARDDKGYSVASGVYIVVADVDGRRTTRKVSLMR